MSLNFENGSSSILMKEHKAIRKRTNGGRVLQAYPVRMPVELNFGRGSRKAGIERLNE